MTYVQEERYTEALKTEGASLVVGYWGASPEQVMLILYFCCPDNLVGAHTLVAGTPGREQPGREGIRTGSQGEP